MRIKLSATFEGKCDICGKNKVVFSAGDEDTYKVVTVCESCARKHAKEKTSEIIEKFGHEDKTAFKEGIRIQKNSTAI
jgi:transcription elongation factor Elf1